MDEIRWIAFASQEAPEAVALWLATLLYPGSPVDPGCPFERVTVAGVWWELSNMNAHKLDALGDGQFRYRERLYHQERLHRIWDALLARPDVTDVTNV